MMQPHQPSIAVGHPVFADKTATSLAEAGSLLAAWHRVLDGANPVEALESVGGHFTVGLADGSGRTVLAVDRFATHSMCYRVEGGVLRFALRADELATSGDELDDQALFDYLYFHVIPSPRTIFRGVHRLPPGHLAVHDNGRLTVTRYWRPEFAEDAQAQFAPMRERFLQLLQNAVADRRDPHRPACFLSGGTDSSTVAGMLARLDGPRPATYSIGFDAQGYDEMAFARIAAKHFGTEHHEYYVTPDDIARGIPMLAAHFDQPFGNSSCLPAYLCARMARGDGVTRLLAGDGGDELFGGNSRYAKQRIFGWYDHVPGALRRGLIEPLTALPGVAVVPPLRKLRSYVDQAGRPMPDRLRLYNLLLRLGPESVFTPALLARVDIDAPLRLQREVWQQGGPRSMLNRELAYDWRFTLAENDLPKVNAATSMAGVEVAYPLLDDTLLDLSLKLPTNWKLRGPRLRWFFKEALRGFLPDAIIDKKKHGFGLPFGVWACTYPALQSLARDSLGGLAARGIVRQDFAHALMDDLLPKHPGYYGEMVWILTTLEQWFRVHVPDYRVR